LLSSSLDRLTMRKQECTNVVSSKEDEMEFYGQVLHAYRSFASDIPGGFVLTVPLSFRAIKIW